MRILDRINHNSCIKRVRLTGLAPCHPGELNIFLELKPACDALEVVVALSNIYTQDGTGYILFDEYLPDYCVPDFTISSRIFLDKTETPESVWTASLAMMLTEADDIILSLSLRDNMVIAHLFLGDKWSTSGAGPLDFFARYLKSN